MADLSKKVCLFFDPSAGYTHMAEAVVSDFAAIKYYSIWDQAFPSARDYIPGSGLDGIEKVWDFWDAVEDADLVVFPDVGNAGLQEWLRRQGMPVFGSGKAEKLERDRWYLKSVCKKYGIDTAQATVVTGIGNLRLMLNELDDVYVKLSYFRGDLETFHHENHLETTRRLNELELKMEPYGAEAEFVVEVPIQGKPCVEVGVDLAVMVNGMYPQSVLWGYEAKDKAYAGCVGAPPDRLRTVVDKLAPVMEQLNYRGPFSTETRETPKGSYFLDATCFSDDTEILTESGWKLFQDLDPIDRVATLDVKTREIVYQQPTAYQRFAYSGQMYRLTSPDEVVDLLITPEHGIWSSRRDPDGRLEYNKAKELRDNGFIPRTGKWQGNVADVFVLPEYTCCWASDCGVNNGSHVERTKHFPEMRVPMLPWLSFLGAYLAEGSCKPNGQVNISQLKQNDKFRELFQGLPWKVAEYNKGFQINSAQLAAYLKEFGKCHEKYVPRFLKQLCPRLIRHFLDAYRLGDGHGRDSIVGEGQSFFFTTSKRMADDLQELIFKAGSVANVRRRESRGTMATFADGSPCERKHDLYIVRERYQYHGYYFEASGERRGDYIKEISYEGFVYDITVPNGTLYVRRNGKPLWTSNCRFPNPPSALMRFMIDNWDELMWEAANGRVVEPDYLAPVGVQIIFKSEYGADNPLAVAVDRWDRTVLYGHCVFAGQHYAVSPSEIAECGSAVGLGHTLEQAMEEAIEVADSVKGRELSYDAGALEELTETIAIGEKLGIRWAKPALVERAEKQYASA